MKHETSGLSKNSTPYQLWMNFIKRLQTLHTCADSRTPGIKNCMQSSLPACVRSLNLIELNASVARDNPAAAKENIYPLNSNSYETLEITVRNRAGRRASPTVGPSPRRRQEDRDEACASSASR
jgi:hypothetical protein